MATRPTRTVTVKVNLVLGNANTQLSSFSRNAGKAATNSDRLATALDSLALSSGYAENRLSELAMAMMRFEGSLKSVVGDVRQVKTSIHSAFNPARVNAFNQQLSSVRRTADRTANSAARINRSFGGIFGGRLGGGAAGIFSVYQLGHFANNIVTVSRELDSLTRKLEVAFPNQGQAGMDRAIAQAKRYGLALRPVVEGYARFAAALADSRLRGQTDALYNSLLTVGSALRLNEEKMRGLVFAFEQMASKGKITAEELRRQLGDRLPGAVNQFARAIGKTTEEVDEMLKAGVLDSETYLPIFLASLEEFFGEAAEKAAQGYDAAINNFMTSLQTATKVVFDEALAEPFVAGLKAGTSFVEGFEEKVRELGLSEAIGEATGEITFKVGEKVAAWAGSELPGIILAFAKGYAKGQTAAYIEWERNLRPNMAAGTVNLAEDINSLRDSFGFYQKIKDFFYSDEEVAKRKEQNLFDQYKWAVRGKYEITDWQQGPPWGGRSKSERMAIEAAEATTAKYETDRRGKLGEEYNKVLDSTNLLWSQGKRNAEEWLETMRNASEPLFKFEKDIIAAEQREAEREAERLRRMERIADRHTKQAMANEKEEIDSLNRSQKKMDTLAKRHDADAARREKAEIARMARLQQAAEQLAAAHNDVYAAELQRTKQLDTLKASGDFLSDDLKVKINASIQEQYEEAIYIAQLTDGQKFGRELVMNFKDSAVQAALSGNFDDFADAVWRGLQASLFERSFDLALAWFGSTELGSKWGFDHLVDGLGGGSGSGDAAGASKTAELSLKRGDLGADGAGLAGGRGQTVINVSQPVVSYGSMDGEIEKFFGQNSRQFARFVLNSTNQSRIGRGG